MGSSMARWGRLQPYLLKEIVMMPLSEPKQEREPSEIAPEELVQEEAKNVIYSISAPARDSKAYLVARVDRGGIDLRVDWDGDTESLGRFEVMGHCEGEAEWQQCERIDTDAMQDLISPHREVKCRGFQARFQRGPDHGNCPFKVKAVPIRWKENPGKDPGQSYIAERGKDYDRSVDAVEVPWTCSLLLDGVQTLILELKTGSAYEMWVSLQHPTNPEMWLELDPIVRTDHGDGAGTPR